MRAVMAVVAHELREQGDQMPIVHHDDVVRALLAKGSHYPLRDRIRQGCPVGGSDLSDAGAGELGPEVSTV